MNRFQISRLTGTVRTWRLRSRRLGVVATSIFIVVVGSVLVIAPPASAAADSPMTLTINTAATGCSGRTVTLPLNGTVDVTVNWGDGTATQTYTAGNPSHPYAAGGTYTISITGSTTAFGLITGFCQLTGVTSWGTTSAGATGLNSLTSLVFAFCNDPNFTAVPTDFPAAVTDVWGMFESASAFNQNISTWNTANVTNMNGMFYSASAFNNGGVSLATTPSGWNTANVTTMVGMFYLDPVFNQNIDNWDTAKVTTMYDMFLGASAFNQNISSWDTSAVQAMDEMFVGDTAFNQSIGTWNTAAVTSMRMMFNGDTAFNQNISTWNTAAVTGMNHMFNGATAFDQSLGAWVIRNTTDMTGMLDGTALSVANYDATLTGWASQSVKSAVPLGASGLTYSSTGATARNTLSSSPDSWAITGDSLATTQLTAPSITFTNGSTGAVATDSVTYPGTPYTASASTNSGGTVTYLATGCAVDSVSGAVTGFVVGTPCVVTAASAANGNYTSGTATLTISVNSVVIPILITFTVPSLTGDTKSAAESVITSAGLALGVETPVTAGATALNNGSVVPGSQSPTAGTSESSSSTTVSFNYFHYVAPTDTITFNSEGGSKVTSKSGPLGTTITLPRAPTYAGYIFNGWFATSSGGAALVSPFTLARSTTLFAHWSKKPPIAQRPLFVTSHTGVVGQGLTFSVRGGSGSGALTYRVTNGTASGCAIAHGVVSAATAGTCVLTATQSGDTMYSPIKSSATTVTFSRATQPALVVISHAGGVGKGLTFSVRGGSGSGALTYRVTNGTASGCAIAHDVVSAATAGTCVLTATKAAVQKFASSTRSFTVMLAAASVTSSAKPTAEIVGTFAIGSSLLTPTMTARLHTLAAVIKSRNYRHVTIDGFASSWGSLAFNVVLSQARAVAVHDYLSKELAQLKVTGVSFNVTGLGVGTQPGHDSANRIVIVMCR